MNRGALAFAAALIVVMTGAASIFYFQKRPRGDPVVEWDPSGCPSGAWEIVVDHAQVGTASTELDAILEELDGSSLSWDLAGDARRIVTTPEENGFLAVDRKLKSATFSLLIDSEVRGTVSVRRFGKRSFAASGSRWCTG